MAKKETAAKPRKQGADPQGSRDARDDATMIQWLSTIDADLTSGFRALSQVFRQRDKSASVTAPGALEQKPSLTQILYQTGSGSQATPIRPVSPVPPAGPTGGGAAASLTGEESEPRGMFASALATLTNALSGLRDFFRRRGDEGIMRAASGANFVTGGPTRLLVGEAGPEKVEVTPLSKGRKPGPMDQPEGGEMRMQGGGLLIAGLMRNILPLLLSGMNMQQRPGLHGALGGITDAAVIGLQGFTQHLREANRVLAEFSPSMAAIFAQTRIRDIQRNIRVGEATAGTAGGLERATADIKDTLAQISTPLRNIANLLLTKLIQGLNVLLLPLEGLAKFAEKILEKLGLLDKRPADAGITIGQWLDEVRDDEKERQRRAHPPFRPRFAGGLP